MLLEELILTEKRWAEKAPTEPVAQPWDEVSGGAPEERKASALEIYKKAQELASNNLKTFSRGLKNASKRVKDAKVLVDIKTENSFIEKVTSRGRLATDITDILRGAILSPTEDSIDNIINGINKQFEVIEHEYKTPEKTTGGYYGAHHFLVYVGTKEEALIAEIQVMTRKLWAYKSEAHKIYSKYKGTSNTDEEKKKMYDKESKAIFKAGNVPRERTKVHPKHIAQRPRPQFDI